MVAGVDNGSNHNDMEPPPGFLEWAGLPSIRCDGNGVPVLAADDVHLWLIPLTEESLRLDDGGLLDDDEQERARRFRFAADRQRFVRAHVALRLILSRYCGLPPGQLRYALGPQGRPALTAEGQSRPDFNMSHTVDWALVGVRREARIGVDIEAIKSVPEWREIAGTHFTPREAELLSAVPEADRMPAFALCWTRKEALAKATGDGISTDLRRFEVAIDKAERPALRAVGGSTRSANLWALSTMEPVPGHVASIAIDKRRMRCFRKRVHAPMT